MQFPFKVLENGVHRYCMVDTYGVCGCTPAYLCMCLWCMVVCVPVVDCVIVCAVLFTDGSEVLDVNGKKIGNSHNVRGFVFDPFSCILAFTSMCGHSYRIPEINAVFYKYELCE